MKSNRTDNDFFLVRSLHQSDHRAFEKLFRRYAQKLFVFSLSYLKNENSAEEIVQEVFLKVWLNRFSLKTGTSFQSYLFTIAFNAIRKSFNKKAKEEQYKHEIVDILDENRDENEFEENYQMVVEKLDIFIDQMPARRKQIFILRKKQGVPVKQIAEQLGLSVKTVENQITKAMRYLKECFEKEFPKGLLLYFLFVEK